MCARGHERPSSLQTHAAHACCAHRAHACTHAHRVRARSAPMMYALARSHARSLAPIVQRLEQFRDATHTQ
eukprot:8503669-Alexandrium_andersonii.AAC.1